MFINIFLLFISHKIQIFQVPNVQTDTFPIHHDQIAIPELNTINHPDIIPSDYHPSEIAATEYLSSRENLEQQKFDRNYYLKNIYKF